MEAALLDLKTERKIVAPKKSRQPRTIQRHHKVVIPVANEAEIDYPDSDGEPMAETEIHVRAIFHIYGLLCALFRNVDDVYVATNMFMYYRKGDPKRRKAPDVMFVKGVEKRLRRTFKLWQEKVAPSAIFEFTSKATINEDTIVKASLYASLGVKEYFLFDPEADYLDEQFIGYRLCEGEYEKLEPDQDNAIYSQEIGFRLKPQNLQLRIIDPVTGEFMVGYEDIHDYASQAVKRAEQEAQRAEHAEAEVAQLRAQLEQLRSQSQK